MTTVTRTIENEQSRRILVNYLENSEKLPLPFTCTVLKGRKRSNAQNRLNRQWCNDIASQTDESAEYWRGYCKLRFGVPIRRAEDEAFCEAYDSLIKPLPYETKLAYMMEPLDFPVTRDFRMESMKAYLDAIWQHFTEQGIALTDPETMGIAA